MITAGQLQKKSAAIAARCETIRKIALPQLMFCLFVAGDASLRVSKFIKCLVPFGEFLALLSKHRETLSRAVAQTNYKTATLGCRENLLSQKHKAQNSFSKAVLCFFVT